MYQQDKIERKYSYSVNMLKAEHDFFRISFSTGICLLIFLMLTIKAGIICISQNAENDQPVSQQTGDSSKRIAESEEDDKNSENNLLADKQVDDEPEACVLITASSGGRTHQTLQITASEAFTVTSAAGTDTFSGNDKVNFEEYFSEKHVNSCSVSLLDTDGHVFQTSESGSEAAVTGIRILSLKKGGITPVYPGILMIYQKPEDGTFYLVNRVLLESYLPGVVSSEMPDHFGLEALKAQAVCARSYAMYVLENEEPETAETGFVSWNLVDTTDDQVYLSGPVDARAVTACEQTRGQILYQDRSILKPHYYSTSWGMKADGAVFKGETTEFLQAAAPISSDFSIEEMNRDFITAYETLADETSGKALPFDCESPWFRWNCRISLSLLSDKRIKEITVTKRGTGGYVSEMMIFYEDGTAELIRGAGSVRRKFGFSDTVYHLQDNSERSGLSILPSAFFYLESVKTSNGMQTVTLHGGGFGHGYGMSQYGAAEMAEKGYSFVEILSYYYEKATLEKYL